MQSNSIMAEEQNNTKATKDQAPSADAVDKSAPGSPKASKKDRRNLGKSAEDDDKKNKTSDRNLKKQDASAPHHPAPPILPHPAILAAFLAVIMIFLGIQFGGDWFEEMRQRQYYTEINEDLYRKVWSVDAGFDIFLVVITQPWLDRETVIPVLDIMILLTWLGSFNLLSSYEAAGKYVTPVMCIKLYLAVLLAVLRISPVDFEHLWNAFVLVYHEYHKMNSAGEEEPENGGKGGAKDGANAADNMGGGEKKKGGQKNAAAKGRARRDNGDTDEGAAKVSWDDDNSDDDSSPNNPNDRRRNPNVGRSSDRQPISATLSSTISSRPLSHVHPRMSRAHNSAASTAGRSSMLSAIGGAEAPTRGSMIDGLVQREAEENDMIRFPGQFRPSRAARPSLVADARRLKKKADLLMSSANIGSRMILNKFFVRSLCLAGFVSIGLFLWWNAMQGKTMYPSKIDRWKTNLDLEKTDQMDKEWEDQPEGNDVWEGSETCEGNEWNVLERVCRSTYWYHSAKYQSYVWKQKMKNGKTVPFTFLLRQGKNKAWDQTNYGEVKKAFFLTEDATVTVPADLTADKTIKLVDSGTELQKWTFGIEVRTKEEFCPIKDHKQGVLEFGTTAEDVVKKAEKIDNGEDGATFVTAETKFHWYDEYKTQARICLIVEALCCLFFLMDYVFRAMDGGAHRRILQRLHSYAETMNEPASQKDDAVSVCTSAIVRSSSARNYFCCGVSRDDIPYNFSFNPLLWIY